ncbi:MAG: GGDEF domain-containing protein [Legionellaceae bacterium]|nr:GGDEF domain-containing protein [Legionellaceae bacterium]
MVSAKTEINVRLLRQLFLNNKRGAVFNLLTSLYVFVYFSFSLQAVYFLLPWYACIVALSFFRWAVANKASQYTDLPRLRQWFRWFLLIILANGMLWGMLYPTFYQEMSDFQRMFTTLIMFGGATIAILSLGPSRLCYLAFILPVMLPIIVMHWPQQSVDYYFFNAGLVVYFLFLLYLYDQHYRSQIQNISLLVRQDELIADLREVNTQLEEASNIDALTKLANRGHLSQRLAKDWARCRRARLPIAVLIIDIDYFKEYNDTYGHLKGDDCLRIVASILKEVVSRETDLAARFGGDEFVVLLYDTDEAGTTTVANQIMERIGHLNLMHAGSPKGTVSVSIGAAVIIPDIGRNEEDLLMMADRALYRVKKNGRDGLAFYLLSLQSA